MKSDLEAALKTAAAALEVLKRHGETLGLDDLASYLYIPDIRLSRELSSLEALLGEGKASARERQQAGYALERIAAIVFLSIKGATSLKSFQSAGPQLDLLVEGDNFYWSLVRNYCGLQDSANGFLLEAKARNKKVDDSEFARLCAIVDTLPNVEVGVFFSLAGATGFPRPGETKRCLSDCRLRQALYFARTGRRIVVFDKRELFELSQEGSFLRLLRRKINEVAEMSGTYTTAAHHRLDLIAPPHIKDLLPR